MQFAPTVPELALNSADSSRPRVRRAPPLTWEEQVQRYWEGESHLPAPPIARSGSSGPRGLSAPRASPRASKGSPRRLMPLAGDAWCRCSTAPATVPSNVPQLAHIVSARWASERAAEQFERNTSERFGSERRSPRLSKAGGGFVARPVEPGRSVRHDAFNRAPTARAAGMLTSPHAASVASSRSTPHSARPTVRPRGFAAEMILASAHSAERHSPFNDDAASARRPAAKRRAVKVKALPPDPFFAPKLDAKMLTTLLRDTNMTRTELYRLFNRFKALCMLSGTPGSIDKKTFKEGVSSLAFEDSTFVDRIFHLLDEDGSGSVEWGEFVNAVNALETGSPEDKLKFCFRVYDSDNSKTIHRSELQAMFTSMLLESSPRKRRPEAPAAEFAPLISDNLRELIDDFVNGIYDAIDADRTGDLDFEEMLHAVTRKKVTDVWEIFGRTLVSRI